MKRAKAAAPTVRCTCVRPTDRAAVRLGEGTGLALSPDGAYAMTRTAAEPQRFALVPVKAGQPREFPPDQFGAAVIYGAFFPDGQRFVFEANSPGQGARLYVQAVSGGAATPVSPEGINYSRLFVSPDARWIAALGPDRRIYLYPSAGGSPTELSASRAGDLPAGWTADGKGLYVSGGYPCRVDVIDVASGARTHVREPRRKRHRRDVLPRIGPRYGRRSNDDAGLQSHPLDAVLDPGSEMTLAAGTKLGPYEIAAPVGAGGMGEVYRARDERLKRDVAIKVLPASFSQDPDRLKRFEQEAQAAGALNHPNITAVYDFGEHDGAPYIVTELLEGETLREPPRARRHLAAQGDRLCRPDRKGPRGRSRKGNRPPRPEAREHLPDQRRTGQDPRLRPREAEAGRRRERTDRCWNGLRRDGAGRRARHDGLHVARASPRQAG